MQHKIKNILLDLDGTLTDPKEGITKSVQYALRKMDTSVQPTMDELEWVIGPPLVDAFAKLLDTPTDARIQEAIGHYRDRYVDLCHIENEPYAGIDQTLSTLQSQDYRLFLATSKPWAYAKVILKHFDLHPFFTAIHGSELDGTRDYKEDLIAYIVEQNRLDPAQTIMIGDREYDIRGAKHNNLYAAVGVSYGYGSIDELRQAGADKICESHTEFPHMKL